MKRIMLRLAALTGVVALGVWTIAQAQRETTPQAHAADRTVTSSAEPAEPPATERRASPMSRLMAGSSGKTSPATPAAAMPARKSAPPARLPAVDGEPISAAARPAAGDRYAQPLPVAPPPSSGNGGGKFDWTTNPYESQEPASPRALPAESNSRAARLAEQGLRELPLVGPRKEPADNAFAPQEPREPEPLGPAATEIRQAPGDRYAPVADEPAATIDLPRGASAGDRYAAEPAAHEPFPSSRGTQPAGNDFESSRRTRPAADDPFARQPVAERQPLLEPTPPRSQPDPFDMGDEPAELMPPRTPARQTASDLQPRNDRRREELTRIPSTAGAASISDVGGSGMPGEKALEGPQTPSLTIHKQAPTEMQVGKPAKLQVVVRNSGTLAAHQVELHDEVPKGTRLVATNPPARQSGDGRLVWLLHTLEPGAERKVEIEVIPQTEGEVGSVASVRFTADATARSVVTRPQLVAEVVAASQVMIGSDVPLKIKLSNPGTGVATGVVLRNAIPEGFQHPAGHELEYEVGDLAPGESRELDLVVKAVKPGKFANQLEAYGDGNLTAREVSTPIEVVAPDLEVVTNGPDRRFLERKAVYTFSVSNPGTASAKHVELTTMLPPGFKFVGADNAGRYDDKTRTVHWLLEELPPARSGTVTLTAMPTEAGTQELVVQAKSAGGLAVENKKHVLVEGVAAVLFQVVDVQDPIEVGGTSAYEIRVVNQGSKAADNVRVAALIPDQFEITKVEGPANYQRSGQRVVFDPVNKLAPKADTTYRVTVRGVRSGDARFRVQLLTDDMTSPVTKEESTRVFGDE